MPNNAHEWKPRPLATLTSEFWTSSTTWHDGPVEQRFKSGMINHLSIQIKFRYNRSYGGDARFRVVIDQKYGDSWYALRKDEVVFDARDEVWRENSKDYILYDEYPLFKFTDHVVRFRVSTSIQGPGHLPTGHGPGSSGLWSEEESKEFKAVFEKPSLDIVKMRVSLMKDALDDIVNRYQ